MLSDIVWVRSLATSQKCNTVRSDQAQSMHPHAQRLNLERSDLTCRNRSLVKKQDISCDPVSLPYCGRISSKMVTDSTGEGKATFSTMGTVSAPIELEAKGEHTAVQVDGGKGKRKISPKVKVTLTSLTPNNVSLPGMLEPSRLQHPARS